MIKQAIASFNSAPLLARALAVIACAYTGWVLWVFEASQLAWLLALILVVYVGRTGLASVLVASCAISVVVFLLVRSRYWPESWATSHPSIQARQWASIWIALWLGMLGSVLALAYCSHLCQLIDDGEKS